MIEPAQAFAWSPSITLCVGDHLLERLGVSDAPAAVAANGKPAREAAEVPA